MSFDFEHGSAVMRSRVVKVNPEKPDLPAAAIQACGGECWGSMFNRGRHPIFLIVFSSADAWALSGRAAHDGKSGI